MNRLFFDSEGAWVKALTSFWCDRLHRSPRMRHCLPAGNTPLKLYAAMAQAVARGLASFRHAEVYALDEYGGVAEDDPGRCAAVLCRHLVDHVDLPPQRFHHFDPAAPDLAAFCRAYEAAMDPGPDLTILGLGLNGHLGLNEPGSALDSPTRRVEMQASSVQASANYVKQSPLPRWGVTVGLKCLLASKEIWLLANGRRKSEILRRTLTEEIGAAVPATFLRQHSNCYLFADHESAALV